MLHDQLLPARRNPKERELRSRVVAQRVCRSRPTCARVGYARPGRRNLRPPGIRDGQHRLDRRGLAQPAAYSVANDDISDLGADTANSSWIYDRIGANLTGLLVITLALGLWRALSPDVLGRIGAGAMLVAGAGAVLDGFFHLDCRGIDAGCTNDSWHSHAHKIESGITGAATIAAPLILAFAFRRIPTWRDAWLPSLLTVPAIVLANVVFSAVGDGAATRAGSESPQIGRIVNRSGGRLAVTGHLLLLAHATRLDPVIPRGEDQSDGGRNRR